MRDGYEGTTLRYKIEGGKLITFVSQEPYSVTVYKLGNTYYGARSNEFGYANYEIIPAPQIAVNPLTEIGNQFSIELGLTEEQKQQILPILNDELKQLEALKKNTSLSGLQKVEQLRGIGVSFDEKIRPLLNAEQQPKFQALRERVRRRMLDKMASEAAGKVKAGGRAGLRDAEEGRGGGMARPVAHTLRRSLLTGSAFVAALLWASAEAVACPICLGAGQPSKAQELVTAPDVVLAVPTRDASRFRVTQVIKGKRPPSGTIEGGYPRSGPVPGTAAPRSGKPLLLVSDEQLPTWDVLGAIDAGHSGWLRKVAAGKRAADMSAEEWRARVALVVPYLENPEPLVAEIAYAELTAAPYAALRAAKPRLSASAVRRWLADPDLAARQPPYLLLLGFVGNAQDAAALEQRLDAAWNRAMRRTWARCWPRTWSCAATPA